MGGFSYLLTPAASNAKTAKQLDALRIEAAILHLSPVDIAVPGKSVCPWASVGCAAACLNTAGRGQLRGALERKRLLSHPIHRARIARTRLFFEDRPAFLQRLAREIAQLQRRAQRKGYTAAVRLNGTSDVPWEGIRGGTLGMSLPEAFPGVQFYDYTKSPGRAVGTRAERWPRNYHLTFSRSEVTPDATVDAVLREGCNVAVVFAGATLPDRWRGVRVIDGLAHDYRFLDPRGVVVGLLAKGRAKRDSSGFVVQS